jgi:hypothetical protein
MADETAVPRDRQIRTEALHAATRLMGKGVELGASLADVTHLFAHYVHAGVWLPMDGGRVRCSFGEACRFNRADAQ